MNRPASIYGEWLDEPRSATEVLIALVADIGSAAALERACGIRDGTLRQAFRRPDCAFSRETLLRLRDGVGIPLPALFERHARICDVLNREDLLTRLQRPAA